MKSIAEGPTELDERLRWLLSRCAAADSEALQLLYTLVSPILFASIIRILRRPALAEEALQDVFISIWQKAGQFTASRGRPMAWMSGFRSSTWCFSTAPAKRVKKRLGGTKIF